MTCKRLLFVNQIKEVNAGRDGVTVRDQTYEVEDDNANIMEKKEEFVVPPEIDEKPKV